VDLVILNDAPIELKYKVIATGKVIFQKNSIVRTEFEADTLSQYFDYLPVLRAQKKIYLKSNLKERDMETEFSGIEQRLERLKKCLIKLEPFKEKSKKEFYQDEYLQDIVERNLKSVKEPSSDIRVRVL